MDLGTMFISWFLSMSIVKQIFFVLGLILTLTITYFIIKGIQWIFYPYKKSHVGRKYFWLRPPE
ncbi:hypothetical protein [Paenibacillus polymyxa]|uniref:hypothetical protein n=1 Tax=Paenibacillus polymyxa TaxID=1406 RepID=UPI0004718417